MAFGREIAKAFVSLFVKKEGLDAGLKQAEQQVKASSAKMQADGAKAGDGLKEAGKTIRESFGTSLLASITGVVAAVGGVAAGFERLIGFIGRAGALSEELRGQIDAATKSADKMIDTLNGRDARPEESQMDQLTKAIDAASEKARVLRGDFRSMGEMFSTLGADVFGARGDLLIGVEDEIERLRKKQQQLSEAAFAKTQRDQEASRNALEEDINRKAEENRLDYWRRQKDDQERAYKARQDEWTKELSERQKIEDQLHAKRMAFLELEAKAQEDAVNRLRQRTESLLGNQQLLARLDRLNVNLSKIRQR